MGGRLGGVKKTYIDDTRYMALYRRTREEEVYLIIIVSCYFHIISTPPSLQQKDINLPNRLKYSMTLKHVCRYATVASR